MKISIDIEKKTLSLEIPETESLTNVRVGIITDLVDDFFEHINLQSIEEEKDVTND